MSDIYLFLFYAKIHILFKTYLVIKKNEKYFEISEISILSFKKILIFFFASCLYNLWTRNSNISSFQTMLISMTYFDKF